MSRGAGALDPRLLRHARATRAFIASSVAVGSVQTLLIIAQAWLLSNVVAEAFLHGRGPGALRSALIALLAVVLARAALAWAAELLAVRASSRAKSQLRSALLASGASLAACGETPGGTGALAVLASRGLDALDDYFSQYLPQLVLAVLSPAMILVAVLVDDWVSAAIIAATIPLVPLFMALVGAVTGERTARQLQALERLARRFLDVVEGLPTLAIFGRAKAQLETVARAGELYRERTMATLRVTFLSSLILELVATVSVALVAVAIGLRLMDGGLGLRAGLFALVLAPEAYLPLRRLGAAYHASAEGAAAADQAFAVIEAQPGVTSRGARPAPDPRSTGIALEGVTFAYPGRERPALLGASLAVRPGETLGLIGPSGCGKSTLLALVMGLRQAQSGAVLAGEQEVAELDPRSWHARIGWLPQRPHLFRASVLENVRLGRADAEETQVSAALEAVGLREAVDALPDGIGTLLGESGQGLSSGERRRVALARVLLREAPLLLLDEPLAGLDAHTEQVVLASLRRFAAGRTAVIVTHRPAALEICDRVVSLGRAAVAA